MTRDNQKILTWLDKEKSKDKSQVDAEKNKLIQEIRKYKKEDLIKIPPKISLWKKIKIMIWGH
jgi:hypothetical protein